MNILKAIWKRKEVENWEEWREADYLKKWVMKIHVGYVSSESGGESGEAQGHHDWHRLSLPSVGEK